MILCGKYFTLCVTCALSFRDRSNLSEFDIRRLNITEAERQESLIDLEWEISCYCNMLYSMVQIFKGDDEFGDELSKLPMAIAECHE